MDENSRSLVDFLRARLDEDEQLAQEAAREIATWDGLTPSYAKLGFDVGYLAQRFHPTRVLAEAEAKRAIIQIHTLEVTQERARFDPRTGAAIDAEHNVVCEVCGWVSYDPTSACPTLQLLALPFADHADYRDEWKPQG